VNSSPEQSLASGEPLDPLLATLAARLGPLRERRIPVYHLDEIDAVTRSLAGAWAAAAPSELLARLADHPAGAQLLSPAVEREIESGLVLRILAPEAVCRAFDDQAGHLDSHTEFGR
jgi:hypothetical protein